MSFLRIPKKNFENCLQITISCRIDGFYQSPQKLFLRTARQISKVMFSRTQPILICRIPALIA
jgi:hypothetical protein